MSQLNLPDRAFPTKDLLGKHHSGLSKREWFAAMILQGLAANPEAWKELSPLEQAELAVMQANDLIQSLDKK